MPPHVIRNYQSMIIDFGGSFFCQYISVGLPSCFPSFTPIYSLSKYHSTHQVWVWSTYLVHHLWLPRITDKYSGQSLAQSLVMIFGVIGVGQVYYNQKDVNFVWYHSHCDCCKNKLTIYIPPTCPFFLLMWNNPPLVGLILGFFFSRMFHSYFFNPHIICRGFLGLGW